MLPDMVGYCEHLKNNNIIVAYNGPLWADIIEGLADTLEKRLKFDKLPLSASKAVFSVFVEQMNNMLMYSAEKDLFEKADETYVETPVGTSILGVSDRGYFVQTGNVMKNETVDLIESRINHLNTLDKKELRKFYKEQIKLGDNNPESKGAGIGLIEVARRSTSKIEYSFTPLKDGLTFFAMYVTIGGGK